MVARSLVPGTRPPQLFQSAAVAQLPVVVFQVQFAACASGIAIDAARATPMLQSRNACLIFNGVGAAERRLGVARGSRSAVPNSGSLVAVPRPPSPRVGLGTSRYCAPRGGVPEAQRNIKL